MKALLISVVAFSLFVACTPKDMTNNKHSQTPIYEQTPEVSKLELRGKADIDALLKESRAKLATNDEIQIIEALEKLEMYVLNLDNLKNPDIHSKGMLSSEYRNLMDLYGFMMVTALGRDFKNPRMDKLVHNYKVTIFSSCNRDNMGCREVKAFSGPYGVSILNHLISRDIKRMKNEMVAKKIEIKEIKDVLFAIQVLGGFGEKISTLHGDLLVSFSSVVFGSVAEVENSTDEMIKTYINSLQAAIVRKSNEAEGSNICGIFDSIDPLSLKSGAVVKQSFITQLSKLFYNCLTSKEIIDRIVKKERIKAEKATADIEADGYWKRFRKSTHHRSQIVHGKIPHVLGNFSINSKIPHYAIHVFDEIFYARIDKGELDVLLKKFSQEQLMDMMQFSEQYAMENFIYLMHFTFNSFNSSAKEFYKKTGRVNKEFVESTYKTLYNNIGDDMWPDFKKRIARLRSGLNDINIKLNASNRLLVEEQYKMKRKRFDAANLNDLINLSVTFPIVMSTTFFAGTDEGGTMEIEITWLKGSDKKIEISTVDPLKHYFKSNDFNLLQLLDFGNAAYQPKEYDKNIGLSLAVKSGFFEVVNHNLGQKNEGLLSNVKTFFARYVDDNKDMASYNKSEIEDLRKIKENHWKKVKELCENPRLKERRIVLSDLYDDIVLSSKEANSSISDADLDYVSQIQDTKKKMTIVANELADIKRTYKVLVGALEELKLVDEQTRKDLQKPVLNHYKIQNKLLTSSNELLADLGEFDNSCLYSLSRFQRYQQNILQKNSVEYLLGVHAMMEVLKEQKSKLNGQETAAELTAKLNVIIEQSSSDQYKVKALTKVVSSNVLSIVETQFKHKGYKLLLEAMNLSVAPHNYVGNGFGYQIRGLSKMTSDLSVDANYLGRRGGFDHEKFLVSNFDQMMRVREEIYNLSSTASEIREYFPKDQSILNGVTQLDDNAVVKLNPNIEIHIENFKHFKDKLGTGEKRAKINFVKNRIDFVKYSLEKLYGNNQEGQQIFNWQIYLEHHNPTSMAFAKSLDLYRHGPVHIPLSLEADSFDLRCHLDSNFGVFKEIEGCKRESLTANNINNQFIQRAEAWYMSDQELYPLINKDANGQLDSLSQIVSMTLLNNSNIDIYKPSEIWRHFAYHKYKEEADKWTWFDQFIAHKFTTRIARDREHQIVHVSILPGDSAYRFYYDQREATHFDEILLPVSDNPKNVLRSFFRAEIMKNIYIVDELVKDVIAKENTLKAEDLPKLSLQYKDIPNLEDSDKRGWVELTVDQRSNGRLKLLGALGYEVENFQTKQKTEFDKYECELLPREGDPDYTAEMMSWVGAESDSCESRVLRWLSYKNCIRDKEMAKTFDKHEVNCPADLKDIN